MTRYLFIGAGVPEGARGAEQPPEPAHGPWQGQAGSSAFLAGSRGLWQSTAKFTVDISL